MNAERLYTPDMLAAAMELADYPPLGEGACHGSARSPACGSTLAMDLAVDEAGRIENVGMQVRACAVGQAAAAAFARHAQGRDKSDISAAHDALTAWLEGNAPLPGWPGLGLIAAARDYPGRHGAMLLPWKAALAALSSKAEAS